MKIAVMGTGGMGGYYGGLLASVGEDVSFIARGEHLKALKSDGLLLKGDGEEMHLKPIMATEEPSEIGEVDVVLFCVKLYDTEQTNFGDSSLKLCFLLPNSRASDFEFLRIVS